MKKLILTALILTLSSCQVFAENGLFLSIGIGYKIQEPDTATIYTTTNGVTTSKEIDFNYGAKDSAIFELFYRKGRSSFGLKHDSQYSTGWPFNDDDEYYKTEIFYKHEFKLLK